MNVPPGSTHDVSDRARRTRAQRRDLEDLPRVLRPRRAPAALDARGRRAVAPVQPEHAAGNRRRRRDVLRGRAVPARLRRQGAPDGPHRPRAGVVPRELGVRGVQALPRPPGVARPLGPADRGPTGRGRQLGGGRRVGPAPGRRARHDLLHDVPGTGDVAALPQPEAAPRQHRPGAEQDSQPDQHRRAGPLRLLRQGDEAAPRRRPGGHARAAPARAQRVRDAGDAPARRERAPDRRRARLEHLQRSPVLLGRVDADPGDARDRPGGAAEPVLQKKCLPVTTPR